MMINFPFDLRQAVKDYLKQFFRALTDDNIDSMSSSVAYSFMLSIFPFLIGVFALLQLLEQSANIVEWVLKRFPDPFLAQNRAFIKETFGSISIGHSGRILAISLFASIGFGSYGFRMIFTHLSKILREENPRRLIWTNLLGIVFAAGAMLVVVVSFTLIMLSSDAIHHFFHRLNLGYVLPTLLNLLRYPVVILALIISSAIVYRVGPKRKMPWSCILLSSILFSCGWTLATYLFGVYIAKFGQFNLVFGTLAGVVIFLMWMYLSAFIFLSAAEIGRIRMDRLIANANSSSSTESLTHPKHESSTDSGKSDAG